MQAIGDLREVGGVARRGAEMADQRIDQLFNSRYETQSDAGSREDGMRLMGEGMSRTIDEDFNKEIRITVV